jgi:hypothetical protein
MISPGVDPWLEDLNWIFPFEIFERIMFLISRNLAVDLEKNENRKIVVIEFVSQLAKIANLKIIR